MAHFYMGSGLYADDIYNKLGERLPITNKASMNREKAIVDLLLKVAPKVNYLTTSYGKSGKIFRTKKICYGDITFYALGYLGNKFIRLISSHVIAFFWILKNVKKSDTVITYNFPPIYAIPLIIKKIFCKFDLIIQFEDFYNKSDPRHFFYGPFEKIGALLPNKFIVSSIGMYAYIKKHNKNSEVILHSGYKIRLSNYESNQNVDNVAFLYAGSLDVERGIMSLIKAFMSIDFPDIRLVITGTGPLKDQVLGCCAVDGRIQYRGYLDDGQFDKLLGNIDICLNPQQSNIDVNFPSKITSYLSAGKYVISSNISSLRMSVFSKVLDFYDDSDYQNLAMKLRDGYLNIDKIRNQSEARLQEFNRISDDQDRELINFFVANQNKELV